jgi:carotenoid 1,2-hydratase
VAAVPAIRPHTPDANRGAGAAPIAFDTPVAPRGYRWWYLDAVSSDRQYGLTVIAFIGSVFSPYYARVRARERDAVAEDHCAFNVALYATGSVRAPSRWAMTERGRTALSRSAGSLSIGPSALAWDGRSLTIGIDEMTCPWPSRLRGTIRLWPEALAQRRSTLDRAGRHRWQPIAPQAPVEVRFDRPALHWNGLGYFDTNDGDEPLEDAFDGWHWSRTVSPHGRRTETVVHYDVAGHDGFRSTIALRYDTQAVAHTIAPAPLRPLAPTGWRLPRAVRSAGDADQPAPRLHRTLEDTPFYSRSLVDVQADGTRCLAVHESLSLTRFRAPWVRMLLPFRMPRRAAGAIPSTR